MHRGKTLAGSSPASSVNVIKMRYIIKFFTTILGIILYIAIMFAIMSVFQFLLHLTSFI